jgi:hypothetical protein
MRIHGNQLAAVCLAFSLIAPGLAAAWQPPAYDSQEKLSKEFVQPATSALIAIHTSKQNIADVVSKNLPNGFYDPNLAAKAYDQVRQSEIAAHTSGDQKAATLLNSYFTKVKAWADKYKEARQNMNATNTMGEDFLNQDSDWQAIQSCEKAFNTMLTSRAFHDIDSCR